MLFVGLLSVGAVPKLNGFTVSFVLAPNENDELGTAAGGVLVVVPKGETFGGAELNADTFVAFALGTALNENADFVSGAAGAPAGAPKGDAIFAAKLNADEELPNAGGAIVLLFVAALNPNGVPVSFVGAANVELLADGLPVWPKANDELAFVELLPKIPLPPDAVVVGVAVWPKPNTPVAGAGWAADVADAPNDGGAAPKVGVEVALLAPNRPLVPLEFCNCDELPNTLFGAPNDEVPNAGAAVGAELLPNTASDFGAVPTVVDPNRFVVAVCEAAVTTGDPNATADEPNAGGALLFAPKEPKTGVAAEPLNAVVDAPNAGGAFGALRLNDPPKLGIGAAVVVGVPNRLTGGVWVVRDDVVVFSIFAPNRFGVAVFVFVTPNGDGLGDAAADEAAPNANVLPPAKADVVAAGAGDGVPNEMPAGFAAEKLKVEVVELVIDVVEDAVPVDGAAVVVVAVNPNDGPVGNAPKDDAPNDGGVAVGADCVAGIGAPFTFLPNENVAIDCALVVGKMLVAVVAVTPNDGAKLVLFGAAVAPKLNPPAAGIVFAAASEAGAAVTGAEIAEVAGAAGFPNENAGKGVNVGMVSSGFFVCAGCEAFTFTSTFEAMAGAGVVIAAANENPPRRGPASPDDAVIVVELVVGAAIVAFIANEIFGFDGSLNVGRDVLLDKASALFAFDVAIVATIGLVGFVATPDTSVTGEAMTAPFFCFSAPVEIADGKLNTDVVVAVLNVTVVCSPVLNDAALDATAIGNSLIFV